VIRDSAGEPTFDAAGMLQYDLKEGLLTRNGVSHTVSGGQVLGSIGMFSLIYFLLFWIWIYVLNDKIQKGPKPVVIEGHPHGGWLAATAGRTLHEDTLTEAKDESDQEPR
jgi:hypothetical protein